MAHRKWRLEPQIGHFHHHVDKYVFSWPIIKQSGTVYAVTSHLYRSQSKMSTQKQDWAIWDIFGPICIEVNAQTTMESILEEYQCHWMGLFGQNVEMVAI